MTTHQCQARISRRLGVSLTGFPEMQARRCGQTVGVHYWTDLLNIERAACRLAGHLGDVADQMDADLRHERVRHDVERDDHPTCNDRDELVAVRPELARDLR